MKSVLEASWPALGALQILCGLVKADVLERGNIHLKATGRGRSERVRHCPLVRECRCIRTAVVS